MKYLKTFENVELDTEEVDSNLGKHVYLVTTEDEKYYIIDRLDYQLKKRNHSYYIILKSQYLDNLTLEDLSKFAFKSEFAAKQQISHINKGQVINPDYMEDMRAHYSINGHGPILMNISSWLHNHEQDRKDDYIFHDWRDNESYTWKEITDSLFIDSSKLKVIRYFSGVYRDDK